MFLISCLISYLHTTSMLNVFSIVLPRESKLSTHVISDSHIFSFGAPHRPLVFMKYTGGQKFGILTLISLSLKNK